MDLQKKYFQETVISLSNIPQKRQNYSEIINGYIAWWGNKKFIYHHLPKYTYSAHGIDVTINPELCLEFNGTKHIIKLYMKKDPLTKNKTELILTLLEAALHQHRQGHSQNLAICLLDIRNSKLFPSKSLNTKLKHAIDSELAYIAALWPNL